MTIQSQIIRILFRYLGAYLALTGAPDFVVQFVSDPEVLKLVDAGVQTLGGLIIGAVEAHWYRKAVK